MSANVRQLTELRRQAGSIGCASANDVRASLRRLLATRPRTASSRTGMLLDRRLIGEEIAPGLRYAEESFAWPPAPAVLALEGLRHPDAARQDVLAFDTETTGLAGGTGTRAFMIGAADWRDGHLRVRQLYLSALHAEPTMLREFAGWLNPASVLVSYNGKCYDRPLLSTRYRLARLPDPLHERAHIDLLHPVRRRYRGIWENCRLCTIERELLGVLREDDLPGAHAPAAWLEYLRGGSAINLRRVAAHNQQDLRSLCALLLHMADHADTEAR